MSFTTLGLHEALMKAVAESGYATATEVQAAAIPPAIAGADLMVSARTGSGKTAAFILPALQRILAARGDNKRREKGVIYGPRILVLTPTRELAMQVAKAATMYGRHVQGLRVATVVGGVPYPAQIAALRGPLDILISTPGRLLDHLQTGKCVLENVEVLVLDEADRMLDMGFFDDIATVAKQCPAQRQTLLFSATYPEGIAKLSAAFMRQPQQVKLLEAHATTKIRQRFYEVREDQRLHAVSLLLDHYRPVSTLAFCNTKQQCRDLVQVLRGQGYAALELHGDLEQRDRDQVLIRFANRSASVLVATDIAARGLDIAQLEAVINVDISPDTDTHTHRIGRTGRVDEAGWAFSLASLDEMGRVGQIEHAGGFTSDWHRLSELTPASTEPLMPPMATLQILGGRKEKIRAGDVLGALTKDLGFAAAQVGKINVNDFATYVAVALDIAPKVLHRLQGGRIKGKLVKLRLLDD